MSFSHHLWPIQRGDVLALRDHDYLFGQGDLLLRVVVVHEVRQFKGMMWLFLGGIELHAGGIGNGNATCWCGAMPCVPDGDGRSN